MRTAPGVAARHNQFPSLTKRMTTFGRRESNLNLPAVRPRARAERVRALQCPTRMDAGTAAVRCSAAWWSPARRSVEV